MTIREQALVIKEALSSWAQTEGGTCVVAVSIYSMWAMAQHTSQGPIAILAYAGETPRGNFEISAALGRVDRFWNLAIIRPQGMANERGAQLTDPVGNNRPFYDLVEEARDIVREQEFDPDWTEDPTDFRSIKPFPIINGQVLDGYIIEFSVGTQLTMIAAQPDSQMAPT